MNAPSQRIYDTWKAINEKMTPFEKGWLDQYCMDYTEEITFSSLQCMGLAQIKGIIQLKQIIQLVKKYGEDKVIQNIEKSASLGWHSIESLKGLLEGKLTGERGNKTNSAQNQVRQTHQTIVPTPVIEVPDYIPTEADILAKKKAIGEIKEMLEKKFKTLPPDHAKNLRDRYKVDDPAYIEYKKQLDKERRDKGLL